MKITLLLSLLILYCADLNAQIVSTFLNTSSTKVDDAMILDHQGNIFGSNYNGSSVYKVTPSGTASIFASGFNTPNGLAFDSQNNLFVCDMLGNRIYKVSYSGIFMDTIFVTDPSGIVKMQNSDTMIFTQYMSDKLNKLSPDGTFFTTHSGLPLNGPVGLAYSNSGELYVGNFDDRTIYEVDNASLTYITSLPGSSNLWLGFITFAQGSLWATGVNDHKIYRIYQNFVDSVTLFAGSTSGYTDGSINTAKFSTPNGIIASATGDSLYISEFNSGRIRIISSITATGIGDSPAENSEITVYPNPVMGQINIVAKEAITSATIYDINGKKCISSINQQLDVSSLCSGEYLLKVCYGNRISVSMFVKQ